MNTNELNPGVRLLRLPEVLHRTGLSRSHLWRLSQRGAFPRPVHFGRAALWPSDRIDAWVADVIDERKGEIRHG